LSDSFVNAFYLLTGLGHQAVMIFFALSGFLVGGKALDDILAQRFSWPRYLLRRLTRLWIVIVPALALTLLFDTLGAILAPNGGYDGRYYDLYASGPHIPEGTDHSIAALLGNLAFVQTIAAPIFGSNGPIWSLANEFWYYIVFPLAVWCAVGGASVIGRAIGVLVLLVLITWLPVSLLEGGAIWVAGAAAAKCSRLPTLARRLKTPLAWFLAVTVPTIALLLSKSPLLDPGDLGLGVVVAIALPVLAHLPSAGRWGSAVARATSEMSYTLYLTHFPFLTVIVMTWIAPMRWPPGLPVAGVYLALLAAAIGWAGAVWWCFERNTDRVYIAACRLLLPPRTKPILR
jgi:peptidoglycan/LPS O-acetylase OafA/YrhL